MEVLLGIGAAWLVLSVLLGVTLGRAISRADRTELTPPPPPEVERPGAVERPDDPDPEQRAA